uniref:Uncharacterized protein n=1 Tax=Anguilla anguilla TaxID=7936 RepID=A0A0E9U7Z4_ANGAN
MDMVDCSGSRACACACVLF